MVHMTPIGERYQKFMEMYSNHEDEKLRKHAGVAYQKRYFMKFEFKTITNSCTATIHHNYSPPLSAIFRKKRKRGVIRGSCRKKMLFSQKYVNIFHASRTRGVFVVNGRDVPLQGKTKFETRNLGLLMQCNFECVRS